MVLSMSSHSSVLLDVHNLSVSFATDGRVSEVVKEVSFYINEAEIIALVGESGSGKSVSALSIMQLIRQDIHTQKGQIFFNQTELVNADDKTLRRLRGGEISMIFQEPMTALNPLHTIERQIAEMLVLHQPLMTKEQVDERVLQLLEKVHIANAKQRRKSYPHELSGGQRQRVMIAMALANNPKLLIADEPTTALDVTIQRDILNLLCDLQQEMKMAIMLITHDLHIVKRMAQRTYVMKEGNIVDHNTTSQLFNKPAHPYTRHLLDSVPSGQPNTYQETADPILEVKDLRVWFGLKTGILRRVNDYVKAVDGVDFDLRRGETIGIVGESGSGKSSLGLALIKIVEAKGKVLYKDREILQLSQKQMRPLRKKIQYVFQDPFASLNPRFTVGQILLEGLNVLFNHTSKEEKQYKIEEALTSVGLETHMINRYPHEFSGGQRQRIAIARSLVLQPDILILDEPTSALDMSVQQQVIALLKDLQLTHTLSYIFISHDLEVVRIMANNVLIMHQGKIVEQGNTQQIFDNPQQEYTQKLIQAACELHAL